MSQNPYDEEFEKDIKIWCPKQLSAFAAWLTPVSVSPFIIYNWLKLKEFKEAFFSLFWFALGVVFLLSPPVNSWIFIIGIMIYYFTWKLLSCKRQIDYTEDTLFDCYSVYSKFPVFAVGAMIIASFFYYLNNSVGTNGFPNRELVNKQTHGNVKLFTSFGFDKNLSDKFLVWLMDLNKNSGGKGQWVHLKKVGDVIQERVIFNEKAINDPSFERLIAVMALKHSKEIFGGVKTEIHLCDPDFISRKVVSPTEEDEKHYFIQEDITRINKLLNEDLGKNKKEIEAVLKDVKALETDSIMKFVDSLASHFNKTLEVCDSYQFSSPEIQGFHKKLRETLEFQKDSYGKILTEMIEGKKTKDLMEKIKSVNDRFESFNEEFSTFVKDYFADFKKL